MNRSTDCNTSPTSPSQDLPSRKGSDKRRKAALFNKVSSSAAVAAASSNRKLWWQKSVVRRSTSSIEPEFDHVTARSQFLQRHANQDKSARGIALFHRSEIVTGQVLGRGGFSVVVEIVRFQLSPEISERCTVAEQRVREQYAAVALCDEANENVLPRYCIKHLQERLLQSPKDFACAASDLAVEAAFMSTLDHEHILSVRGLPMDGLQAWGDGQHDGYFIVMDRLLGGTLDQRILDWQNSGARVPTIAQRTAMAAQLASALEYLHSNRIIFRDLKPANIGLTADHHIKLLDFGLCRELPHHREPSACGRYDMSGVGTRRYMAPEIINDAKYNLKADVYGWSMVFWEMLSLTKPYAPYSTTDHRREVCERGDRPDYLYHVPRTIQQLLQRAWDQNVPRRLSMDQVVQHLRMAMAESEQLANHELNLTNHALLVQPSYTMPDSPTGVHDFGVNTLSTKSLDAASIQACPELFDATSNSKNKPLVLPEPVMRRTISAMSTNKSLDSGSIERQFHHHKPFYFDDSPPPVPKKPPAFLSIPDYVVNSIALAWSDDDDISDIDSLIASDESFVEHMMNEVDL
jgi:serine/threonine protein kinase